jgi:hypothetical protein
MPGLVVRENPRRRYPSGLSPPGEEVGGKAAPTRLSSGELRLDLSQVSFDVVVQAKPGRPGWQFTWKTPAEEPAKEFVPATSRGRKEWHNRKRP